MDATLLGVVLGDDRPDRRRGGAAHGINLPLGDLIIGATTVELGYAVATGNLRDFSRIPGLRVVQL
jgi:predicted nucleic acid-binding protein